MLATALEEAIGFLERARYQRGKKVRGYRNGYPNALSYSLILTRLFSNQRLFVNPAQTSP